jgi:tetratricopeptide (TPR) repeat protein
MYLCTALFSVLVSLLPAVLFAKEVSPSYTLTLGARVGYALPMGTQADLLNGGINANIFMNYNPKLINNFLIQPEFTFSGFRLKTNKDMLSSFYGIGVNGSYNIPIFKFIELNTITGAGYYFNKLVDQNKNELVAKASNPYIKGGAGLDFVITYNFNMNASVIYVNYLSADEKTPTLSFLGTVNYRFGKSPEERGYDRSIEIGDIQIKSLFSALYKYYETNRAGTIRISNISKKEVKKVTASVMVKDFMDFPTAGKTIDVIKPGETVEADLNILFNNRVLSVTEDTPLSANVSVNYLVAEREFTKEANVTFDLYNRNAMTWDDTKKLASFITPKDTPVKVFARSVIQQYQGERINVLNQNLQSAIEVFDAIGSYGLAYVPDPKTPFTKFSENEEAVDYIQYPRETLRFKTGDCDDMTALYCSLLENIGISTAFITTPGHIFMMFDTGVSRYDYPEITDDRSLLVEKNGTIWIPVEITLAGEPFVKAWKEGAQELNETISKNQDVGFYLTGDAWSLFVPVTLEEFGWEPEVPSKAQIAKLFDRDINTLVGSEMEQKIAKIQNEILAEPKSAKLYNKLGVTYARYGRYEEALKSLEKAVALDRAYFSAYNNLGNVYYLTGKYEQALTYYKKALNYSDNALILINIARTLYKLGSYEDARTYYLSAVEKKSSFKDKYAYLETRVTQTGIRASDRARMDTMVEWDSD